MIYICFEFITNIITHQKPNVHKNVPDVFHIGTSSSQLAYIQVFFFVTLVKPLYGVNIIMC